MAKIIWQPILNARYDFTVHLDRDFAKEMINAHIHADRQTKMNQLGKEELKELNVNWLTPYLFHKDSCFISQVYLGEGVWLSTKYTTIDGLLEGEEITKPVDYHSHNVRTSRDAYILMALFDKWVNYADALKDD